MIVVVVNMFIFLYEICQLRSWTYHKTICTSIATLHGQHKEKTYKSGSYSTNLTPKEKKKVAELIGDYSEDLTREKHQFYWTQGYRYQSLARIMCNKTILLLK